MDPPSFDNNTEMRPSQRGNSASSSSSKRARESPPSPADFYVIGKDIQNRFGQIKSEFDPTLVVVWRLQLRCGMPLFVLQSYLIRTDSASSLGTLLYEVLPNWRTFMCSHRWAHWGHWPQNTPQIHLAIDWSNSQLGAVRGKLKKVMLLFLCCSFLT